MATSELRTYAFVAALACGAFFGARALDGLAQHYQSSHGPGGGLRLDTVGAVFAIRPSDGALYVESRDGKTRYEGQLVLRYRDLRLPLSLKFPDTKAAGSLHAALSLSFADVHIEAEVDAHVDPAANTLDVKVTTKSISPPEEESIKTSLSLEMRGEEAFVPGVGVIADSVAVSAPYVMFGEDAPLAITGSSLVAFAEPEDGKLRVSSSTDSLALRVQLSSDGAALTSSLNAQAPDVVKGIVHGVDGSARVVGLDDEGLPRVRFVTKTDGRFEVRVPREVTNWYASVRSTTKVATSAPTYFPPGTGYDLQLDVSEGGEIEVHVTDGDTHAPLTARLLVHGVEGTLDPSFGPDFRASGAGPLIDALRGSVITPLPKGRYRVAATKGFEWSIDAVTVDVGSDQRVVIDLAPRHVVPTPGVVGCDLHVHARPSFDSPVLVEDRVLSLVSAGVDFAVPTEHNIVGDYGPALEVQGLTSELATVHGVEVTTYSPRFGHFGVFPYPLTNNVPPFRDTTIDKLFKAARAGDPKRILQVNHPRLPKQIGYFETSGFRPGGPIPKTMRTDFDTIEVYNGYDLAVPSRVDAVLADWFALLNAGLKPTATGSSDSHRIQYQWAGYPRTLVATGDDEHIDPARVVEELKKGHATVSSGPVIDLELEGARPGDEIGENHSPISGHVVVRAAPWIDVTSLDIVVGGKVTQTLPIATRPTSIGKIEGPLEDARARCVRLDAELHLMVTAPTWVVVIARGTRMLDDVLPFMPVPPMAFTNPIWVAR